MNDGAINSVPDTVVVTTGNVRPRASAGLDQTYTPGSPVSLDADGSSDADGDALMFAWHLVARPAGSSAMLSNPTTATPSLTGDVAGDYVASLRVFDGALWSAADSVVITTGNSVPVADAGPDQTVPRGLVTLHGERASDADGDSLTRRWSFVARPLGSIAVLSSATVVAPTFVADVAGTYVVQLIVNDSFVAGPPDTVVVEAADAPVNRPPTAAAGASQTVHWGATVHVSGAGSTDPDGDVLQFTWALVSRPASSSAQLSDVHLVAPVFVADRPGVYAVALVVSDGKLDSIPASVTVAATNEKPVAVDDLGATKAQTAVDIDVLANDSDDDGDPIAIASITQPANGSASFVNGRMRYIPTLGL